MFVAHQIQISMLALMKQEQKVNVMIQFVRFVIQQDVVLIVNQDVVIVIHLIQKIVAYFVQIIAEIAVDQEI